jgi:putative membrane protein
MGLLTRWLVSVLALTLVVAFMPGIRIVDTRAWFAVGAMALVLGLVNATVRPLLRLVSRGLIAATFGLFLLAINAATFGIASWIAVNWLGIGFFIDGLLPAFWGALLVSGITLVLSFVLVDRDGRRRLA